MAGDSSRRVDQEIYFRKEILAKRFNLMSTKKTAAARNQAFVDALNASEKNWHDAMMRMSEKYDATRSDRVAALAGLFSKYKTHPARCYDSTSPVRVFQKMFPENYYSRDMETFLRAQKYTATHRGADLPWWGEHFFTGHDGYRVCLVAQDSNAKDAGSVALYAHLLSTVRDNRDLFKKFEKRVHAKRSFFHSWSIVREQLQAWNIDPAFLYVTDAKKVYSPGSWKHRDFDVERSKELLEAELRMCAPDLIILLGASPLSLLDADAGYASVVGKDPIMLCGAKTIAVPFFIGQGKVQKQFAARMKAATLRIRAVQKICK